MRPSAPTTTVVDEAPSLDAARHPEVASRCGRVRRRSHRVPRRRRHGHRSGVRNSDTRSRVVRSTPTRRGTSAASPRRFVATVVLQLADERRLDLDAGIQSYFPDLKDADRITARELLQHTSGLREYNDQPQVLDDPRRHWTPDEMIAVRGDRRAATASPVRASTTRTPTTSCSASSSRRSPATRWDEEVHTRIVEPLGMTHTDVITTQLGAPAFVPFERFVRRRDERRGSVTRRRGGSDRVERA